MFVSCSEKQMLGVHLGLKGGSTATLSSTLTQQLRHRDSRAMHWWRRKWVFLWHRHTFAKVTYSHVVGIMGRAAPGLSIQCSFWAPHSPTGMKNSCLRKAGTYLIKHLGIWKHQATIQDLIYTASQILRRGTSVASTELWSRHSSTGATDSVPFTWQQS